MVFTIYVRIFELVALLPHHLFCWVRRHEGRGSRNHQMEEHGDPQHRGRPQEDGRSLPPHSGVLGNGLGAGPRHPAAGLRILCELQLNVLSCTPAESSDVVCVTVGDGGVW